jgi:hypothetical protein
VNGPDTHQGRGANFGAIHTEMFGIEPRQEPPSEQQLADEEEARRTEAGIKAGSFITDVGNPLWELHPDVGPLHGITSAWRRIKYKKSRGENIFGVEERHLDDLIHFGHDKLIRRYQRHQAEARETGSQEAAKSAADDQYEHDVLMSYQADSDIYNRLEALKAGAKEEGRNFQWVDTDDPEVGEPDPYATKRDGGGWKVKRWNFDEPTTTDLLLLKAAKWNRLYHRRKYGVEDGGVSWKLPTPDQDVRQAKEADSADWKRKYYDLQLKALQQVKAKQKLRDSAESLDAAHAAARRYDDWRTNFISKVGNTEEGLNPDRPWAFYGEPTIHRQWAPMAW